MHPIINDFTIHNFLEVKSTNDTAFQLITENQAFDRHIIISQTQSAGRGRMDRKWLSFTGNLYFSTINAIDNIKNIGHYSFLTACILGSVLKEFNIKTQYKWPNDIIFCNKKLSGILLQMQKIHNINYLVIGIGLNLKNSPDYAISLKDFDISKTDFLEKFTIIFNQYLDQYKKLGFLPIKNQWQENAYKIGQNIKLSNDQEGIFEKIDDEGNLLLNKNGKINRILCEEIFN